MLILQKATWLRQVVGIGNQELQFTARVVTTLPYLTLVNAAAR